MSEKINVENEAVVEEKRTTVKEWLESHKKGLLFSAGAAVLTVAAVVVKVLLFGETEETLVDGEDIANAE